MGAGQDVCTYSGALRPPCSKNAPRGQGRKPYGCSGGGKSLHRGLGPPMEAAFPMSFAGRGVYSPPGRRRWGEPIMLKAPLTIVCRTETTGTGAEAPNRSQVFGAEDLIE